MIGRHEIHTEIEIGASAEQVWHLLTDFAGFARWNPFMREASGVARRGASLRVSIEASAGRRMVFRPRVTHAARGRELAWVGRYFVPGLCDGDHAFVLVPEDGGARCRLINHENFSGLLVPYFQEAFEGPVRSGFVAMNDALKHEAERLAA